MADRLKTIPLSSIIPADDNLRTDFTGIEELAQSIAFIGLLEPPRVQETDDGWKLIAGERRYRALQYLVSQKQDGFTKDMDVKVVVGNKMDDATRNAAFLIENMQRVDLDVVEEVEGVRRLVQEYQLTTAEVAENLGVTKQWVDDRIAMLDVPAHVMQPTDKNVRRPSVEALATLGRLDEKVRERLTKDGKVPSQYDIEDRMSKQRSKEKGEAMLRKLLKKGKLVCTEKDLKRIIKTPLEELSGVDNLIKIKCGPAVKMTKDNWARPTEPTAVLKTDWSSNWLDELDNTTVAVLVNEGGFAKWRKMTVEGAAKPTVDAKTGEVVSDVPLDEYDEIDARNDAKREAYETARMEAKVDYVANTKAAELTAAVLYYVVDDVRNVAVTCQLLGLDVIEPDYPEGYDGHSYNPEANKAKREASEANHKQVVEYATKNGANLARAAAAALLTSHHTTLRAEMPAEPEYEDYPDEDDDDVPFDEAAA